MQQDDKIVKFLRLISYKSFGCNKKDLRILDKVARFKLKTTYNLKKNWSQV
jgi:hypothetical protein